MRIRLNKLYNLDFFDENDHLCKRSFPKRK